MSFRGVPNDLGSALRSIYDRLNKLEKTQGQSRQNTVHLGQWVIEAEGDKRLKMTNIITKEVTYVGDQYIPFVASKEWSYAGTVAPSADVVAPAWSCPHEITLTHVVVMLWTASASDYTITTYVEDSPINNTVILAGQKKKLITMDLTVRSEDKVYPVLAAAPTGTGTEMSITYWYTGIYQGEM